MDVFPSRRAVVQSLVDTDFEVTSVNVTASAETLTVPAYGFVASIANKSYGFVEVYICENRSGTAGSYNTGAGEHLSIIYTRKATSSIDLNTTALAVLGFDDYVTLIDDSVSTDATASIMIIPNAVADLQTIYEKYHS